MKPASPCHFCDRRKIGCHIDCKEYNEYCTELARINNIINVAKENEAKFIEAKKRVKRSNK